MGRNSLTLRERAGRHVVWASFCLFVTLLSSAAESWTSLVGNEIVADVIEVSPATVLLKSEDGDQTRRIELRWLSPQSCNRLLEGVLDGTYSFVPAEPDSESELNVLGEIKLQGRGWESANFRIESDYQIGRQMAEELARIAERTRGQLHRILPEFLPERDSPKTRMILVSGKGSDEQPAPLTRRIEVKGLGLELRGDQLLPTSGRDPLKAAEQFSRDVGGILLQHGRYSLPPWMGAGVVEFAAQFPNETSVSLDVVAREIVRRRSGKPVNISLPALDFILLGPWQQWHLQYDDPSGKTQTEMTEILPIILAGFFHGSQAVDNPNWQEYLFTWGISSRLKGMDVKAVSSQEGDEVTESLATEVNLGSFLGVKESGNGPESVDEGGSNIFFEGDSSLEVDEVMKAKILNQGLEKVDDSHPLVRSYRVLTRGISSDAIAEDLVFQLQSRGMDVKMLPLRQVRVRKKAVVREACCGN